MEDDVAAIQADHRHVAAVVRPVATALTAVAVDAHAGRLARQPVADEHVSEPVGVVRDEVRGGRLERDVAAVGAECGPGALAGAGVAPRLATTAGEAGAGRLAGCE